MPSVANHTDMKEFLDELDEELALVEEKPIYCSTICKMPGEETYKVGWMRGADFTRVIKYFVRQGHEEEHISKYFYEIASEPPEEAYG